MHNPNLIRRPPLEAVQAFVDVATHGSFNAAGDAIGVAHSSLSRKVAYLEQWLGMPLLVRSARGVNLTSEGMQHFLRFREGLGMLELPRENGVSLTVETLQISSLRGFGSMWLFPRHHKLIRQVPTIKIAYLFDRRVSDFSDGTDIAFRYGSGIWDGALSERMFPEDARPVVGALLEPKLGTNASPEQILQFPLIHVGTDKAWRVWLESQGRTYVMRETDLLLEDQDIAIAAIRAGLGIGLSRPMWRSLVDDVVFYHVNAWCAPMPFSYYIVRPANRVLHDGARKWAIAVMQEAGVDDIDVAAFVR